MKRRDCSVAVNWSGVGRVKISFFNFHLAVRTVPKVTVASRIFIFVASGTRVLPVGRSLLRINELQLISLSNDIQLMGRF